MNTKRLAENLFEVYQDETESLDEWGDLTSEERAGWKAVAEFVKDELIDEVDGGGRYLDDEEPGSLFDSKAR